MYEMTDPIKTARLVLRPFTAADEEDMLAFESLPEVARYLMTEPLSPAENALELARRRGLTVLREEGDTLLVAVEHEGRVIGWVQLIWHSAEHRQGEFGYVFHPDVHGRGFATESAVEMLRIGFEHLRLHRIVGRCDPRNTRSAAVLERIGLRKEAHFVDSAVFKGDWGGELVYAMLDHEWTGSRWAS